MSTTTRRSPPTRPPPAKGASASGLARSRLRRNEFAGGRHKLVGIELRSFERGCDPAILLEHRHRLVPIPVGHPSQRLTRRVRRHPCIERQLRLASRYSRHRCFREFLDDGGYLVEVRTAVEKAFEAGGNEAADELGIVPDESAVDGGDVCP